MQCDFNRNAIVFSNLTKKSKNQTDRCILHAKNQGVLFANTRSTARILEYCCWTRV